MVLDIKHLLKDKPFNVQITENEYQESKLIKMTENYGQFKLIKVCKNDGIAKVIDGYKYLLILKNLGFQKVNCHYFGELDKQKYAALRIYFNHNEKRIDTLEISQAIGLILKNKNDIKNFSIQTGINEKDVERYVDISRFDWDSFNKKTEAFSGQTDLFKTIKQIENEK